MQNNMNTDWGHNVSLRQGALEDAPAAPLQITEELLTPSQITKGVLNKLAEKVNENPAYVCPDYNVVLEVARVVHLDKSIQTNEAYIDAVIKALEGESDIEKA